MSRELRPYIKNAQGEIIGYVDDNTFVGYDFIKKEYYVKNIDTLTVAPSPQDAKTIFDITAPGNSVKVEEIQALSTTLELISNVYYTLEDSGRYIKTISFNDHDDLAIQYNEPYLYIRGSNEMWDMSSSIGASSVSFFFWQYYVYYLGMSMPRTLMDAIINYYKKIQKPYVYNTIVERTDEQKDEGEPLMYTNQFITNNADKSSRGEYSGTKNPNNIQNLNTYDIVSASGNCITCAKTPECDRGDLIQITSESTKYADNLVVDYITENNIYLIEPIGVDFTSADKAKAYVKAYGIIQSGFTEEVEIKSAIPIKSIHTVNVSEDGVTNTYGVVKLLTTITDHMYEPNETVYIGENAYTVKSVTPTQINTSSPFEVQEGYVVLTTVPSEEPYDSIIGGDTLMLEVHNLNKVLEDSLLLTTELPLKAGDFLEVVNADEANLSGRYEIKSIDGNKVYLSTEENTMVPEYVFSDANKGMVQLRMPSKQILLNMTYSKRADKMPTGEFMLDNDQQFSDYLEFYSIVQPTPQNFACVNQEVIDRYYLGDDLLIQAADTIGYKVVEDVEELKKYEGNYDDKKYAFVVSEVNGISKFTRYMYEGSREEEGETIYIWDLAPTPVYMLLKGVYSDIYETED